MVPWSEILLCLPGSWRSERERMEWEDMAMTLRYLEFARAALEKRRQACQELMQQVQKWESHWPWDPHAKPHLERLRFYLITYLAELAVLELKMNPSPATQPRPSLCRKLCQFFTVH